MAKQPETIFKERAMRDLKKKFKNIWFVKTQMVVKRGIPDLLICLNGWFIAIELKCDGEVPTPLQEWNLQHIAHAGGMAFVVDPSGWLDLLDVLQNLSECESALESIKKKKTQH
jgi:hypothetical protein